MKISALSAVVCACLAAPAFAGFIGPADPIHWVVANTGTLVGGSPTLGTAVFNPTTLVLTGSNSISPDPASFEPGCAGGIYGVLASPCQIQATLAAGAGTYDFDWSYLTADGDGPAGDIFGVIVDDVRIAISDPGGDVAQPGGHRSFHATTSFGFFVNCTDCIGGNATATITNFAVVPEPGTTGLVLLAGAALGAVRRRKTIHD
jgi:hypothetical protein